MDICFWLQNTHIVWIVSKFVLFRSYEFRVRVIHQFVNLILVITLHSIQQREYLGFSGSTVNMTIFFWLLFIFQLFTHKLFTTIPQLTRLMDQNYNMFGRIQKLTFSIYVNKNIMQGLVNIEKPCVLFFKKTKHIIKPTTI